MANEFDFRLAGEMAGQDPERPYTRSASDLQMQDIPGSFSTSYNDSGYGSSGSAAIDFSMPSSYYGNNKESGGFWSGLASGVGSYFGGSSGGGDSEGGWSSGIWSALITAGVGMANNWLKQDAIDQERGYNAEQSQLDRDFKSEQAQLERDFLAQQNAEKNAVAKEIAAAQNKASLAREGLGNASSLINTRANALGNRAANRTLTTNARTLVDALK